METRQSDQGWGWCIVYRVLVYLCENKLELNRVSDYRREIFLSSES